MTHTVPALVITFSRLTITDLLLDGTFRQCSSPAAGGASTI